MTGVRLLEQNLVLLAGRLTHDPEVSRTSQGTARCRLSIAVNRRYMDKATGEWKDDTSYIPVVVWREAAERCKDKLSKGSPVHVEGRIRSREYDDKNSGQKRKIIEVEARRVQFLAPAKTAEAPVSGGSGDAAPATEEMEEVPF